MRSLHLTRLVNFLSKEIPRQDLFLLSEDLIPLDVESFVPFIFGNNSVAIISNKTFYKTEVDTLTGFFYKEFKDYYYNALNPITLVDEENPKYLLVKNKTDGERVILLGEKVNEAQIKSTLPSVALVAYKILKGDISKYEIVDLASHGVITYQKYMMKKDEFRVFATTVTRNSKDYYVNKDYVNKLRTPSIFNWEFLLTTVNKQKFIVAKSLYVTVVFATK